MTQLATHADDTLPASAIFTGKERDSESGNDYFGARYYASTMGRFLSPDWSAKEEPVPYAKLDNPQTLNLYQYMRNNPLGGVDADGHQEGFVITPEGPVPLAFPISGQLTQQDYNRMGNQLANFFAPLPGILKNDITHPIESFKSLFSSSGETPAPSTPAGSGELHAPGDVPSGQVVVHGGQGAVPSSGTYSGSQGATAEEAGKGVPHGTIKETTAGAIRDSGGEVRPAPEPAWPGGPINGQHVNITGGQDTFGPPRANPAPKDQRIPSRPKDGGGS